MFSRRTLIAAVALGVLIVVTTFILEISLQLAAWTFPQVGMILLPSSYASNIEQNIPDDNLIVRGNPQFPDHDKNGFRNRIIPTKADIVTIGDSHTYGQTVEYEDAWPRVLASLTSCRVYNMAVSAGGPLQYAILAEEAIRFAPRFILVGIYFGNDFSDNWDMYLRHPNKYPIPESLLQPAIEAERKAPLSEKIEDFFRGQVEEAMGQVGDANSAWSLRFFLSQHSALWGFGRAIKNSLAPRPPSVLNTEFKPAISALTQRQLEYASIFEGTSWKTIFTSRYREAAENDDDPRIRVGYWLTEWAVSRINDLAKKSGIRSFFVLLPTKESVFASKVRDMSEHNYLEKLTREENLYRNRLIQFMEEMSIDFVDMRPVLEKSVAQPYFENADGHPNPVGHRIIATRLLKEISKCQ
jgi:hypothetical protein